MANRRRRIRKILRILKNNNSWRWSCKLRNILDHTNDPKLRRKLMAVIALR